MTAPRAKKHLRDELQDVGEPTTWLESSDQYADWESSTTSIGELDNTSLTLMAPHLDAIHSIRAQQPVERVVNENEDLMGIKNRMLFMNRMNNLKVVKRSLGTNVMNPDFEPASYLSKIHSDSTWEELHSGYNNLKTEMSSVATDDEWFKSLVAKNFEFVVWSLNSVPDIYGDLGVNLRQAMSQIDNLLAKYAGILEQTSLATRLLQSSIKGIVATQIIGRYNVVGSSTTRRCTSLPCSLSVSKKSDPLQSIIDIKYESTRVLLLSAYGEGFGGARELTNLFVANVIPFCGLAKLATKLTPPKPAEAVEAPKNKPTKTPHKNETTKFLNDQPTSNTVNLSALRSFGRRISSSKLINSPVVAKEKLRPAEQRSGSEVDKARRNSSDLKAQPTGIMSMLPPVVQIEAIGIDANNVNNATTPHPVLQRRLSDLLPDQYLNTHSTERRHSIAVLPESRITSTTPAITHLHNHNAPPSTQQSPLPFNSITSKPVVNSPHQASSKSSMPASQQKRRFSFSRALGLSPGHTTLDSSSKGSPSTSKLKAGKEQCSKASRSPVFVSDSIIVTPPPSTTRLESPDQLLPPSLSLSPSTSTAPEPQQPTHQPELQLNFADKLDDVLQIYCSRMCNIFKNQLFHIEAASESCTSFKSMIALLLPLCPLISLVEDLRVQLSNKTNWLDSVSKMCRSNVTKLVVFMCTKYINLRTTICEVECSHIHELYPAKDEQFCLDHKSKLSDALSVILNKCSRDINAAIPKFMNVDPLSNQRNWFESSFLAFSDCAYHLVSRCEEDVQTEPARLLYVLGNCVQARTKVHPAFCLDGEVSSVLSVFDSLESHIVEKYVNCMLLRLTDVINNYAKDLPVTGVTDDNELRLYTSGILVQLVSVRAEMEASCGKWCDVVQERLARAVLEILCSLYPAPRASSIEQEIAFFQDLLPHRPRKLVKSNSKMLLECLPVSMQAMQ